jgi:hypothetical protein
MGIFQKLTGIIGSTFQIGGTSGSILKNNSGAVEAKNAADNAFVPVNAGTPTAWGNNAVVTATMLQQAFIVGAEFDGGSPPTNSGTVQYRLCTTASAPYVAGDLAFDNGTSTGTVMRIAATPGMIISVTASLSGGVLVIGPGAYAWNGSSYDPLLTGYGGINKTVEIDIGIGDFGAGAPSTKSSSTLIPANARILRSRVQVQNGGAFDNAATVSVGYTGAVSRVQATTDNNLLAVNTYVVEGTSDNADWNTSDIAVLLTLNCTPSAPTVGAARVTIEYVTPDN